jgi:hypothetical protein
MPSSARAFEQRLCRGVRHLALEIRVDVLLPVVVPVREEGGERAFREYHEVAAVRRGLPHQHDHACHGVRAAVRARDRAELGGADGHDA